MDEKHEREMSSMMSEKDMPMAQKRREMKKKRKARKGMHRMKDGSMMSDADMKKEHY